MACALRIDSHAFAIFIGNLHEILIPFEDIALYLATKLDDQ